MSFDCLVVCDELAALDLIIRELDESRVKREICTDVVSARRLLAERRFDCIIVDCDSVEGGRQFLKEPRRVGINHYAIIFALIAGGTTVGEAFELGANFVLDKPLSHELLMRSLRAAQGFMLREQRRAYRHPMECLVTVNREKQPPVYLDLLNISEGGLGLKHAPQLKPGELLTIECHATPELVVEGTAEVIWTTADGRAGLRFLKVPRITQLKLHDWLGLEFERQAPTMFAPHPEK